MKTKMLLTAAAVAMERLRSPTQLWTPVPSLRTACGHYVQQGKLADFSADHHRPSIAADTTVQISNDEVTPVVVECEYINEQKARVDFIFTLSGKATASWDVGAVKGIRSLPPNSLARALIRSSAPSLLASWFASRSTT